MKEMYKPALIALCIIVAYCAGNVASLAQMLPPPPVINGMTADTFTPTDRKMLAACYRMTRAMHTRLFPLSEEQRILNGGSVDLQ